MKTRSIFFLVLTTLLAQVAWASGTNDAGWDTIQVDSEISIVDDEGKSRLLRPSCAFDDLVDPVTGEILDNAFRFYFKKGKTKKLVVYFNGGGACWDDATCVSSLALNQIPGARSTYNPSIHQDNSPVGAGGIFDDQNRRNPFKRWSKVYIPYCTGDIHIGSNNQGYVDTDGSVTGLPGAGVSVQHRGFDNFMAVREWLKSKYSTENWSLKKLLVAGSSAGGYGATFNFPFMAAAFPNARAALIADGSNAIVTQGFVDSIFVNGGNWKVENSLPQIFKGNLGNYYADSLNTEVYTLLASNYPHARIGKYTTAFDNVQVQFLKIMDQLDQGNTNPLTWGLTAEDGQYFFEWNARMEATEDLLADINENYQFYIGEGSIHTILTDAFATEETPHPFYQERSAENVRFTRWISKLKKNGRFRPKSVKYSK